MKTRDLLLTIAVVIVWGLNFPVIRITLGGLPPLMIVALRYTLVCLPFIAFMKRPPMPLRHLAAYGLVLGTLHQGTLFLGIRAGLGAGLSSLVLQTQAFFTLALAAFLLKEPVKPQQVVGLILGGSGLLLVALSSDQTASLAGFALVLASAVLWAVATLISKYAYAAATGPINPLGFIVWASAFPILPTIALSLLIDGPAAHLDAFANLAPVTLGGVLFIAIGSTLFGFVSWNWLISKYGAGYTSQFGLLVPIVGMASSALILGETISPVRAFAAALVIIGLMISIFGGRMLTTMRARFVIIATRTFYTSPQVLNSGLRILLSHTMDTYNQLIQLLDANGASYRKIDHAPEGRTDIVSGMRGNALAAAAKCIVVMIKLSKKEKKYVLAVVPGDARLDLNKLKAAYNGEYISFASPEIAQQLTGCEPGTILPFSFNPDLPVLVDPSLLAHDEIFFNAARLDQSLALTSADYQRLANASVTALVAAVAPAAQAAGEQPIAGSNPPSAVNSQPSAAPMYGKDKNIPEPLYKKRHSLAHVMAEAVLEFFPDAKPTIGPPIENGFYYDFGVPKGFTPEDLSKIEARMREIVKKGVQFERREVSVAEARALFKDNPFKLELIDGLVKGAGDDMGDQTADGGAQTSVSSAPSAILSVYTQDGFTDLCRGPHVASTSEIDSDAFKLNTSSGAYWRGNEKNPMLQRIYGLAFDTQQRAGGLPAHAGRGQEARSSQARRGARDLYVRR